MPTIIGTLYQCAFLIEKRNSFDSTVISVKVGIAFEIGKVCNWQINSLELIVLMQTFF